MTPDQARVSLNLYHFMLPWTLKYCNTFFLLLGAETGNNNWDLNFQSFSLLVLENFDASPNFPKVRGNHCFINCISLRLIYTLKDPNLQYPKKLVASCQKKNSKISCRSSPFKNAIYFRSTISSSSFK